MRVIEMRVTVTARDMLRGHPGPTGEATKRVGTEALMPTLL